MEQFISEQPQTPEDLIVQTKNEIQFALAADCKGGFDEVIEKEYALRLDEYRKAENEKGHDVLADFRKNPEETLSLIKEAIGFQKTETEETQYTLH